MSNMTTPSAEDDYEFTSGEWVDVEVFDAPNDLPQAQARAGAHVSSYNLEAVSDAASAEDVANAELTEDEDSSAEIQARLDAMDDSAPSALEAYITSVSAYADTEGIKLDSDDEADYTALLTSPLGRGLVEWEITELLDDEDKYVSRRTLHKRIPHLVISTDEQVAALTLTPETTQHLLGTLGIVDNIYHGRPAVAKRRSVADYGTGIINWWFSHKIRGTLMAIITVAVLYTFVQGVITMSAG